MTPIDDATDVEGDVTVIVVFSEPMDTATLSSATFSVTGPSGVVAGTLSTQTTPSATTARFRPTDELSKLESYTITIAADVTDLAGNPMDGPFASSFTVAERWWHPAESIQSVRTLYPQVTCDGAGNLMAVWQQVGSNGAELHAARRIGSTWQTPERLDTGATPTISFELASIASGDAIVGWEDQQGVWVRAFTPEDGWIAPVKLATWGVGTSVAINAGGDALAAWLGATAVTGAHYTRSGGWETAMPLTTAASSGGTPVAIADSGDGLVLWHESVGGTYRVWAREYSAASGWGPAQQLSTPSAEYASPSGLAMLPSGEAIALWSETAPEHRLVARRYAAGSGWSDTTVLPLGPAGGLDERIEMDPVGNAIAIWAQHDPDGVVARRFDATTGTWGDPTITTVPMGVDVEWPALSIAEPGHAFAAWDEWRTSNGDRSIVAAYDTPEGLVTSDVEELDTSDAYSATVAACPGETAIVMWTEEDGLYASEFR